MLPKTASNNAMITITEDGLLVMALSCVTILRVKYSGVVQTALAQCEV
jgi:hypothetical protein